MCGLFFGLIIKNTLLTTKQITVTWQKAKNYIRKKGVVNRFDRAQDNETSKLADADLI